MGERTRLDEAIDGFIDKVAKKTGEFGKRIYDDLKLLAPMLGMLAYRGAEKSANQMLEKVIKHVEGFKKEIRDIGHDVKKENIIRREMGDASSRDALKERLKAKEEFSGMSDEKINKMVDRCHGEWEREL